MQYLPIQTSLELKTCDKQLLGSLPLDITLPGQSYVLSKLAYDAKMLHNFLRFSR